MEAQTSAHARHEGVLMPGAVYPPKSGLECKARLSGVYLRRQKLSVIAKVSWSDEREL